jgi:hypothetical protein
VDFSVARLFKMSERLNVKILAEAFNLLNHPNFQQSPVDNVQYTTTQGTDADGNNLPVWTAAANPQFGSPLAIAPRVGSRNLQLSARFTF